MYIESKSLAVGKCRSKTGKRLHVLSVAFSPDGKLIAAGCSEGTIQVGFSGKKEL